MKYSFNGKSINIPDSFIEKSMANLGLTRQEAIELYLSDEGLITNEEQEALNRKAKETGTINHDVTATRKRKAPERKPDYMKRGIIGVLAEFTAKQESVTNVEVTNIERMIAFEIGGEKYELTLTKKRKPKN